ncbi:polysaccharide biosynthesis/export family protein [Paraburkholderia saeva]|nr:polysaccharide biosynthesis/export family protein [Paraburkholderia saeva]
MAIVSAAVLVSACAMAPGMTFQSGESSKATTGTAAVKPAASTDTTIAVPGAGAQGISKDNLVEITGSLVEQQREAMPKGVAPEVQKLFDKPRAYVLGPGDILNIVIWDHPELNMPSLQSSTGLDSSGSNSIVSGYTIDGSGMVQFAYVGMLHVAGLTEAEARELLAKRLGEYVRNPQVTLRIQAYRSKRIYLDGEVHTPGLQILNDVPMTLPEAINRAGGFTAAADRSSVAVTRGDNTVLVNMPDLIEKGANPSNILLRDGDLVRVYSATDSKVFVLGEVARASTLTLNNGKLTLNEALGDAGGVSQYSGDAQQVYVVRGKNEKNPVVYHLDASTPAAMALADNFELKPNDVVFVDASSLVRWSRVVSLLIPTAQSASVGKALVP